MKIVRNLKGVFPSMFLWRVCQSPYALKVYNT
jgi:hypothetical protein